MRTARLKLDTPAIYHCTSRIIEDRRILDGSCKDFLLKNLHLWAFLWRRTSRLLHNG